MELRRFYCCIHYKLKYLKYLCINLKNYEFIITIPNKYTIITLLLLYLSIIIMILSQFVRAIFIEIVCIFSQLLILAVNINVF